MIRRAAVQTLIAAMILVPSLASAAPPTLTYLYPAGVQRGKSAEITAAGVFGRWPVQGWASAKGLDVKAAKDKGRLIVTAAAEVLPGTYWVRLFDDEGASVLRPFQVGVLPEVMEREPNDDFRKPHVLDSASVAVNGRLDKPGDVDCFAANLRKGQTLVASLEAHRTLRSPMDGVLQIVDADGNVLEQNNDYHGLDPQIAFAVPRDGTYIVRTFAFPAEPDASIRFSGGEQYIYRLTLTTGGFADHAFPLALSRSHPVPVDLVGCNIPEAARRLTVTPALDSSSAIVHHPQVANSVAVRVEPHATLVQTKPNDRQRPQTIALPITISGCLEQADAVHAYRFEARKGQRLIFQAEAQALGFPLTPVLRLVDAAGKSLAQAEGPALGRDPELGYQVSQDGSYQIELRDLHSNGGPRCLYRLRAILAEPDFDLTVATDRLVLTAGKPLEVPITIERRHGFDGAIDLAVEGLPEGVSAAVLPLAPGAKSATLRLSGGTKPASVPLRIVGKASGKQSLVRTAQAAIPGFSATTADLWLTVGKPAK